MEVDASKNLVQSVEMTLPMGKDRIQQVVFNHKPNFCSNCKILKRKTASCNFKKWGINQIQAVETSTKQISAQENGQLAEKIPDEIFAVEQAGQIGSDSALPVERVCHNKLRYIDNGLYLMMLCSLRSSTGKKAYTKGKIQPELLLYG